MEKQQYILLILALAVGLAVAGEVPADVVHRRAVAAALDDAATFESALSGALKDSDPMVRRYALHVLYERDPQRAVCESKSFLMDESVAVRQVAKSMNRKGGLYRENVAKSLDPLYDHDISPVKSVKVTDGRFAMDAALPEGQFVELRFGKPKTDLYVWLNGVYLGQFDTDNEAGREFRLEATNETKAPGENVVEVRDAQGTKAKCRYTVEVLK